MRIMVKGILTAAVLTALAGGGWVAAQTPPTPKSAPTTPAPRAGSDSGMMGGGKGNGNGNGNGNGMMGGGMMGNGMMGGGMMGGGMMGCPMVGGANTKVDVKKVDKGVSITMTSSDPATAARLQKMGEAMRLMHEAMTQ